jgi:hypothetical protein
MLICMRTDQVPPQRRVLRTGRKVDTDIDQRRSHHVLRTGRKVNTDIRNQPSRGHYVAPPARVQTGSRQLPAGVLVDRSVGGPRSFFEKTEEGDVTLTEDGNANPGSGWELSRGDLTPETKAFVTSRYFSVHGSLLIIN